MGAPRPERITRQAHGRALVTDPSPGDWVAVHWGWACDRLTKTQLEALNAVTAWSLRLANETI